MPTGDGQKYLLLGNHNSLVVDNHSPHFTLGTVQEARSIRAALEKMLKLVECVT